MAQKKKQHYVPKLYMRQFVNDDNKLCSLSMKDMLIRNNIYYEDQCYENYYYGSDLLWENRLGELETEWGVIIDKLSKRECRSININEVEKMKEFILYQWSRTVANNNYEQDVKNGLVDITAKMIADNMGLNLSDEEIRIQASKQYEKVEPKNSLEHVQHLQKELDDLSYLIIDYETEKELIFSDTPVIMINQFDTHIIGLSSMGLVAFFPVSRHKLFVIYDSVMYPQYKYQTFLINKNKDEVKILNIFQFLSTEKLVFSHREEELCELCSNNDYFSLREENREANKVGELGPAQQKMLFTHPRRTFYKCELSFCRLPKYVKRILIECREAGPRYYDSGWEDKYRNKCEILPKIYELNQELKENVGLSPTKIKQGCLDMYDFSKYYWKMHG